MKSKKYKIRTVEDMANAVTEENLENFIEGLRFGLKEYLKIVKWAKGYKKDNPIQLRKKLIKNTDYFGYSEFEFIDDGKQNNEIEIKIRP